MSFITAKQISSLGVELLTRNLVLPMTVSRVPGAEFGGDNGDTITVRVPQTRTARVQATPGASITYDDGEETGVDVSLTHLYDAQRITDEEMTLELVDFARQVSKPQMASVATSAEDVLASAMNGVAADGTITFASTASPEDTESTVLEAREKLSASNVPAGDRTLAVSPTIATRLLSVDKFVRVDESGSRNALRDASLGRLYGFTIVESNALDDDTAVAYHASGFTFASRAPTPPRGAGADSSNASEAGVAMRQIFQWQPDILSDASVVSSFAGAALVDATRVVRIGTSA